MSSYLLALLALFVALLAQSVAAGFATELFLRRDLGVAVRRSWLALAVGALLFALHSGYALELAVSTGLHDLRQALLAAAGGGLLALAVAGFRRRA
jgi:hypothetical protein